ncbi:hypothetical protein FRZ06_05810 [Anoxybacterium hadale]|uniref:Uncharacterized protein n=1 Tax=Anoxybacterium hadale TaxID=3408580 RepID=A0ACD1A8X4_9FIRM|nr:hypothetical protein FRZ06_05810 [Clostridiales bacterium]
MNQRPRILVLAALFVGVMVSMAIPSFAADKSVTITLPNSKVTINGQVVNNNYSKYPLIVYKDITYFPMTFSDCRFLGIESTWTGEKTGLLVDFTGVTAAYNPYLSSSQNKKSYSARIVSFPVKVNGKVVDISKEEYPFLSFRDITYFPMTWKYGVDAFGWDYKFDGKTGLVIQSKNIKVEQYQIPKTRLVEAYGEYEGKKSTAVMAKNGFVYYVTNKGAVMQAPLADISKAKAVFQLGIWSYGDGKQFDSHEFYEENRNAMLFFHSGGATMGSDHRYILKENGTVQKIQESYHETTLINNKLYMYYNGPMAGPGNLSVEELNASGSRSNLGSADYWFYSFCTTKGLPNLQMNGDELYIRASNVTGSQEGGGDYITDDPAVYKVNVSTNAVSRVSQSKDKVISAQISANTLYYMSASGEGSDCTYSIYKHSLIDGAESFMGSFKSELTWDQSFAVIGDHIYYLSNGALYRMGSNESLNPAAEAITMSVTGDHQEYLVCTFMETQQSKYRIMVFDQSGKAVFKTSDCGSNIVVEGNALYFYNITTETLCKAVIN